MPPRMRQNKFQAFRWRAFGVILGLVETDTKAEAVLAADGKQNKTWKQSPLCVLPHSEASPTASHMGRAATPKDFA